MSAPGPNDPADQTGRPGAPRREPGTLPPREPGSLPPPEIPDSPKITVTRVAAARTKEISRRTVRRIGDASRADGAGESGLTRLIWLNAVQTGADAMIAVALANTIFFSAATSQQRGNVALYLAITMAPFAVVAPVLGPFLDKLQHGRRFALAGTMGGRVIIAWVMAANFHNIGLYPAALGFLVLSKAYGVLKGACVPRVLPAGMSLVTANARLSIFGLACAAPFGAFAGGTIKLLGDTWGLRLTGLVFLFGAVLALRLPKRVDSARGETPAEVIRSAGAPAPRKGRRALGPHVVTSLRGACALRGLSGFLTLFLAFLIQDHYSGTKAVIALGALAVAAGGGSFVGTAAGARLKLAKPEVIVLGCAFASGAMCVITALLYSLSFAVITALIAGIANSLAKLALDAIVQREVRENLRASAFGRSETLLQLAWVIGGAIGIALPMNGRIGFGVAAAVMAGAITVIMLGRQGGPVFRRNGSTRIPRPAMDPDRRP
ncbi:MAG TPA: MFS transporter [Mycobacteriales bacterium]|nr:MFS transporter [Mycobacteriales bacterium]